MEQYKALMDEQYEINLSFQLAPDREKVCIAVTDTGTGIPLEKQAAVFNRFEKLDDYKPDTGFRAFYLSFDRRAAEWFLVHRFLNL